MTKFAVRNPVTVLVLAFMLLAAGAMAYWSLPRESFPEIKVPYIFVNTVYPGASPEDIEKLVTEKIEDQLDGLDGVKKVTSQSMESVSAIQVQFNMDVDVETALRRVKDKVDMAKSDLPTDAEDPIVQELNFSSIPVFIVSLTADYGTDKLETVAENMSDKIKAVPGVLDAVVTGKQDKEISIDVDPDRMQEYGLTLGQITSAIQAQHRNIPGGSLKAGGNKFTIKLTGELKDPEAFNDIIVRADHKSWAAQFRADVACATGLGNVNIAVSTSRATAEILARIRSDIPLFDGSESELDAVLGAVTLDMVPWLGKASRDQMERYHLRTLSEVRRFPHAFLKLHFGDVGERLSALARGLDVEASTTSSPALAEELVLRRAESDYVALRERVHELADRLSFSLRERHLAAREVRLRLSWADGQEVSSSIRAVQPCGTFLELRDAAWTLLSELSVRHGALRALRLSAPRTEAMAAQEDLFASLDGSLASSRVAHESVPRRWREHESLYAGAVAAA